MRLRGTQDDATRSLASATYNGKTLALIHTGAALAVSFALTLCNLLLSNGIANTGGLSGIGTRTMLQATQSVLSIASTVALPFWQIGFLYAGICYARNEDVHPGTLLEGFRRFGPVLRLFLLEMAIFVGVGIACLNAAGFLIMLTPFFDTMAQALEPVFSTSVSAETLLNDPAITQAIVQAAIPMYVLFGVLFLLVSIPLSYRLRMAQFAIMDDAPGALAAIAKSLRMMRGNCLSLFRADLRFWWFYGLKILVAIVAYGDILLGLAGVTLPVSQEVLYFGFYGLYIVLELGLSWRFAAHVQTTYGHCYDKLKANMPKPKMLIEN